jgi:hypothetical protein
LAPGEIIDRENREKIENIEKIREILQFRKNLQTNKAASDRQTHKAYLMLTLIKNHRHAYVGVYLPLNTLCRNT